MIAPLRVGVVGVGYLGRIHAKIYASMPDVELVGVADVDASAAERIAAQHGCAAFTDSYALVDIVDAVSIAVPTSVHAEVAMPYLDAGVHMLLEKPIAPSVEEAERIVEAADRSGVRLLIGHLERFNAGIMALADRVTDPRFIEVHRLGTFVERATDVDVVTDLMIHDIDIVLSLVKSELSYVSAVGSAVLTNHVDIANARLEFANNTVANVTASRVSSKKFRRIRVFSGDSYQALNFIDQQIDVVRRTEPVPGQAFPGLATETVDVTPRPPLDAELEHFIATVRNGAEPLVNGREGLKALRVAEQVQQKIKACLR
jgi:predicted dehydrogenase